MAKVVPADAPSTPSYAVQQPPDPRKANYYLGCGAVTCVAVAAAVLLPFGYVAYGAILVSFSLALAVALPAVLVLQPPPVRSPPPTGALLVGTCWNGGFISCSMSARSSGVASRGSGGPVFFGSGFCGKCFWRWPSRYIRQPGLMSSSSAIVVSCSTNDDQGLRVPTPRTTRAALDADDEGAEPRLD